MKYQFRTKKTCKKCMAEREALCYSITWRKSHLPNFMIKTYYYVCQQCGEQILEHREVPIPSQKDIIVKRFLNFAENYSNCQTQLEVASDKIVFTVFVPDEPPNIHLEESNKSLGIQR